MTKHTNNEGVPDDWSMALERLWDAGHLRPDHVPDMKKVVRRCGADGEIEKDAEK